MQPAAAPPSAARAQGSCSPPQRLIWRRAPRARVVGLKQCRVGGSPPGCLHRLCVMQCVSQARPQADTRLRQCPDCLACPEAKTALICAWGAPGPGAPLRRRPGARPVRRRPAPPAPPSRGARSQCARPPAALPGAPAPGGACEGAGGRGRGCRRARRRRAGARPGAGQVESGIGSEWACDASGGHAVQCAKGGCACASRLLTVPMPPRTTIQVPSAPGRRHWRAPPTQR